MDIEDVKRRVCETLDEMDGDEVSDVYNYVRADKIRYVGDSVWEKIK